MKKNITLVILAAGMGSRFGGLKQIAPMGPNGEFIIDYSVYDAIRAGFNKIVFIIKRENYELFKETIGKRVEPHIKVEYVFQELNNLPNGYTLPEDRVKPLGTSHAILCAKNNVHEPFAIINADDFYGKDAFIKAYDFLSKLNITDNSYGIIGYEISNTLTENGSVKRGICEVNDSGYLSRLTESKVEKCDGKIIANPLDGSNSFEVNSNTVVNMNFLLFTPTLFNYLEELFPKFFEENKDNLLTSEFLIPISIDDLIKDGKITTKVIRTTSSWHGITYKEDTGEVKRAINDLISQGDYKCNLWD